MKNMKFRCESKDHRKKIENELLRLGFIFDMRFPGFYLFANSERMRIYAGINECTFKSSAMTETTLEELKAM